MGEEKSLMLVLHCIALHCIGVGKGIDVVVDESMNK